MVGNNYGQPQTTLTHKTSLIPPRVIEVPVSSQESGRSCRYVLEVSILPLFLRIYDWTLKLLRQCCIFVFAVIILIIPLSKLKFLNIEMTGTPAELNLIQPLAWESHEYISYVQQRSVAKLLRHVSSIPPQLLRQSHGKYMHVIFSGVRFTPSLVLCVMFCGSLFVLLSVFFRPLCCLFFFDLRIPINPWLSSNSSDRLSFFYCLDKQ